MVGAAFSTSNNKVIFIEDLLFRGLQSMDDSRYDLALASAALR